MRVSRHGRELYAIGSNPDAAALAGIPTDAACLHGVRDQRRARRPRRRAVPRAQVATVNRPAGTGYELIVVAAVVVGGVAIFGGSGTVVGAALGAILLKRSTRRWSRPRISSFWDQAIAGALLLAAISFDGWLAYASRTCAGGRARCDLCRVTPLRTGYSALAR